MAKPKRCPLTVATPRRRSTRWPDYNNDNSEPQVRDAVVPAWPTIKEQAAPTDALAPTPSGRKLSSQADLAERLNVSIATLARARKKGRLVGHLIEGQWRFTEQQIADYLKLTERPLRLYGRPSNDNDLLDVSWNTIRSNSGRSQT